MIIIGGVQLMPTAVFVVRGREMAIGNQRKMAEVCTPRRAIAILT
jgi:hypothetical protein